MKKIYHFNVRKNKAAEKYLPLFICKYFRKCLTYTPVVTANRTQFVGVVNFKRIIRQIC